MSSISVCLAAHNGEKYIRQQIDSILRQLTYGDELIISDDGSTDTTLFIIAEYKDKVNFVQLTTSGGVVRNFTNAIMYAKNPFILFCDQDDIWLDGRVEFFREKLTKFDLVLTNASVINSEGLIIHQSLFDYLKPNHSFIKNILKNSFIGCCMGINITNINFLFPLPHYIPFHDWLIALVCIINKQVLLAPNVYTLYRKHDSNVTNTGTVSKNNIFRKLILRFSIIIGLAHIFFRYFLNYLSTHLKFSITKNNDG